MCRITEGLVLDVLKSSGCNNTKSCVVLPVATGMALLTSLLYLRQCNPQARCVLCMFVCLCMFVSLYVCVSVRFKLKLSVTFMFSGATISVR